MKTTRDPRLSEPSITCRAPTHTTAAVPSAISTPTALEYSVCSVYSRRPAARLQPPPPHHPRRVTERDQPAARARVQRLQRVQPPAGGQAQPARRHETPLLVVLL